MGRCWATPTSNKDDTDSYELIRCDGCAVSTETAGQESIQLIANNVQSPSFKYRSFIWRHLDEYSDDQKIWVHCELSACLEDEDNSCPAFEDSKCASSAVCSKKKRSILAAENAISTGGFRVKQKQVTKIEVAHKISKTQHEATTTESDEIEVENENVEKPRPQQSRYAANSGTVSLYKPS